MEDETSSSSLPKGSAADGEQMELDQQNPQIETKPAVQILNEFLDHIETDVKKQIYQEGSEKLSSSSSAAIVDGDHRHRMTEKEADEQLLLLQQNTSSDNGPFIFEKTPPYIKNGALREYQIRGLNWLIQLQHNGINGILADEMGLGKTLQTISVLGFIKHYKRHNGPFLIIAHKSKLQNWENEFKRWCPTITTCTLIGDEKACNKIIQEEIQSYKFEALITSYKMALKSTKILKKFMWRYLVIDEAHSTKNERRRLFEIVRLMKSKNRLLITGTQPQNNLHELWALLKFLLPEKFASTEQFDSMFADDTVLGNENQDLLVKRLHKILQLFLLRRLKSDVEKSLLPKKELLLKMGMSNMQHERYNKIMKDLEESGKVEKKQLMSILMQLRKCTNHPYLFDGAEQGPPYTTDKHLVDNCGKMVLLDKLLIRLKEKGSRVLIFSSMSRMLDILEDFCWWRRYSYCRLDGNTAHEERQRLIDAFNVPNSEKFIFMLTKMVDGLDINLAAADVAIFYDSDSNPQVDLRAIDRTHRNSSDKQVQVFRLITENTPEERMIEKAEKERCLGRNGIQRMSLSEDDEDDMLAMIRPPDDEMDLILKRAEEQTKEFKKRLEKQASTNGAEEAEDKRSLTPFEVEKANNASESSVVKRCRQYMLHSRIAKGALIGEFVETTGRNCVTIASPKFAFMAAHCVPEGFPEDRTFKVYGNDNGESYKVRIHHIARSNEAGGNDFAILKLQSGEFPFYPPNASMTETGDSYFVLGYDGEFPLSDRLSCFKGTFRNTEIYLGKNYVIGTPGTTSGCSGGGVFSMHGTLYGICVSGRIDGTLQPMSLANHLEIMKLKLSEPSYSHIIPAVFLFGHIPQTRKRKGDGSAMQQWKRVQGSS